MEFKKGDKVRVYDSAIDSSNSEFILTEDRASGSFVMPTKRGRIWVHTKQLELIERPKQKVKLYQYAYFSKITNNWYLHGGYYKDDDHFTSRHTGCSKFKRTEITTEVDDE